MNKNIGIIIPAYNEEGFLGNTLEALKTLPEIENVLVVDDGSQDDTANVAKRMGAQVLSLDRNYGKGHALKQGIGCLDNTIIVFLDADTGNTAKEVVKLIDPILKGSADVTIGKIPFSKGKGGLGFVKALSQFGFKILTGTKCTSVLSGQRAFRREVLDERFLSYKGYGVEFGMTVDLVKENLRIQEIPLEIKHRVTSKSLEGFLHRGRQFLNIFMVIVVKGARSFNLWGTE
ncbi:MAG: glycosyltransferase family 2 protein [Clostridiales bacterium]|nr:glycosyltransferase family 2 protein [Clostridiales bacterium]